MHKHTLILLIFISYSVFAQKSTEPPDLVTDRPDQTESSSVVPKNHLQIETGFVKETDKANDVEFKNFAIAATLFRYGILDGFELRLGGEYTRNITEFTEDRKEEIIEGMAPFFFGLKAEISEEEGLMPETAFLFHFKLPYSGAEEFRPDYSIVDFRFAASNTITEFLSLGYNLGGAVNDDFDEFTGFYSVAAGFSVFDMAGAFVEFYGDLPSQHFPQHKFDAGITFLLLDNLQLDASAGVGISGAAADSFFNFGVSWRVPR